MSLGLALQARPKVQAIQLGRDPRPLLQLDPASAGEGGQKINRGGKFVRHLPGWDQVRKTKDAGNPRPAFQGAPFQAPKRLAASPLFLTGLGPVVRHKDHDGLLLQLFVCKNLQKIANSTVQLLNHVPV